MSLYESMTKKELFDICEELNISFYKSKNKPELIKLINEKLIQLKPRKSKQPIQPIVPIEDRVEILEDDEDEQVEQEEKEKDCQISDNLNDILNDKFNNINISEPIFEPIFEPIVETKNYVIETSEERLKKIYEDKINNMYLSLHKANMRALNIQFQSRAMFPVAVYNNLEALKKRISICIV